MYRFGRDDYPGSDEFKNCVKIILAAGATVNVVTTCGEKAIHLTNNLMDMTMKSFSSIC